MIHTGTYTIENNSTGDYRTFLVKHRQPEDKEFMPGKRLVGLLTGPDNFHDFKLFGYVDENSDSITVFKKHKSTVYEKYARMIDVLIGLHPTDDERLKNYTVRESRLCRRCGRKLTTPESLTKGIGPECEEKDEY
jgi:hypothetical protein